MSQSTRRASALAVHLAAARAENDRLREEIVVLHARVVELETALAASQQDRAAPRRGLASLIPGG